MRLAEISSLLRKYSTVFAAAWSSRHETDGRRRLAYEAAFLPANLELIETPTHPAARWAMLGMVALGLVTLAIAVFGQLDIVVSANGKLLPNARVKVIQPAVTGVVKSILVKDGEGVVANQLLVELDTAQAAADSDKARAARLDADLAAARARALLDVKLGARLPAVAPVKDATFQQMQEAQRLAESIHREFLDKVSSARSELHKREAEYQTTQHEIAKLSATAPLGRQQADDYRALARETYVAKHEYLAKEQLALEQENELRAQQSHATQLRASIEQQRFDIAGLTSQFNREQLDVLTKANQSLSQNRNDEAKAQVRERLLSIRSPVAGTVQQLATHTIGGVVTTAQSLMVIVPEDTVEVEANVENKDIGFVKVGQDVTVKVVAFPYTRFGSLRGRVVSLSSDAVQDKRLGLTFTARVHLESDHMRINDKLVELIPGLEVTAEINTGHRSVAHYFLDPLVQMTQESLRER